MESRQFQPIEPHHHHLQRDSLARVLAQQPAMVER